VVRFVRSFVALFDRVSRALNIGSSSYTCGGVGHLSRDCGQGSNATIVLVRECFFSFPSLFESCRCFAAKPVILIAGSHQPRCPHPKGALATLWIRRCVLCVDEIFLV